MRLYRILLAMGVLLLPLGVAFYSVYDQVETPRLNAHRVILESTFIANPGDSFTHDFVAEADGLTRLEITMQLPWLTPRSEQYELLLNNLDTGEARTDVLSSAELWDDVGEFEFEPFDDSAGQRFELVVSSDLNNTSGIILAFDDLSPDDLIVQPYYQYDTSFVEALEIVLLERLSWRMIPFALLLPLLVYFCAIVHSIVFLKPDSKSTVGS